MLIKTALINISIGLDVSDLSEYYDLINLHSFNPMSNTTSFASPRRKGITLD